MIYLQMRTLNNLHNSVDNAANVMAHIYPALKGELYQAAQQTQPDFTVENKMSNLFSCLTFGKTHNMKNTNDFTLTGHWDFLSESGPF